MDKARGSIVIISIFAVSIFAVGFMGIHLPARAQTGRRGQWTAFNRAGGPTSNLQCFTPNNVRVSGGNLAIDTKAEVAACSSFDLAPAHRSYTSGFVSMRAFNFLYGTVEFRAKFGGGTHSGAWPAVWMADASCQTSDPAGTDDRCNEQEIDIAEILKSDFTHVNQQIHVDRFHYNDSCTASTTDASRNFHVYQLVWSAASLVFKIDGIATCTITRHIPNAAMYLKIDMNVGGFGGPVNNGGLPWTTVVDYVKVTQGSNVVFNEDFDREDAVEPAPAHAPSSLDRPNPPHLHAIRLRWAMLAAISSLAIIWVLTARWRRGSKRH